MKNPTFFAGQYRAASFAYGVSADVPGLTVDMPGGVDANTSTQTLTVAFGSVTLTDGTVVSPLAVNTKVTVGTGAGADTVTPSAVSNNTPQIYQSTNFTAATFANSHGTGDLVASATVGLQEAINFASGAGGGIVIIDEAWYKLGGTQAIIAAASVPSTVVLWDTTKGGSVQSVTVPLTLAQIQNAFTTAVPVIPAPGAGNMVDVIDAVLNLTFGTNAFTTGGAAQLSYGTGVTYPATATVAAAVYTGLAANTIVKVAGVAASSTSSDYLNKAINYTNATAAFAAGTGCAGSLTVNYRILNGLS